MDEHSRPFEPDLLLRWCRENVGHREHVLGRGYQASVYICRSFGVPLVIKAAPGRGPGARLRRRMLRAEAEAYARLDGLSGVPRCHGLLAGRFLVLDFIDASPFREAAITDRGGFFDELRALIGRIHQRGVAHGDLKKKDNLLVVGGRCPAVIDFGAAVTRKPGFAPLNHYLFRLAQRFDINACVKLRLGHTPAESEDIDGEYRRTLIESVAGRIKHAWLALKPGRRD